jgi:hypothetical protein
LTPITKAEKKIQTLKTSEFNLSNAKKKQIELAIGKMETLVEIFIGRKRKTEKDQIEFLYNWFEDEFNIIYENTIEKIKEKDIENG